MHDEYAFKLLFDETEPFSWKVIGQVSADINLSPAAAGLYLMTFPFSEHYETMLILNDLIHPYPGDTFIPHTESLELLHELNSSIQGFLPHCFPLQENLQRDLLFQIIQYRKFYSQNALLAV